MLLNEALKIIIENKHHFWHAPVGVPFESIGCSHFGRVDEHFAIDFECYGKGDIGEMNDNNV